MKSIVQFLQEVRIEMGKVQWPKYDEFVGATVVTLLVVLFFALFIGAVDRGVAWIIKQIFTYSS